MLLKKIVYRISFLGMTILLIPLIPILIIFLGINSPEYVIHGTLNLNVSQSTSTWEIYSSFLKNICVLDFGTSTSSGRLVTYEVKHGLRESFKLISIALFLSYTIGTAVGFLSLNSSILKKICNRMEFLFYIPIIIYSYLLLYFLDLIGISFLTDIRFSFAAFILSIYPFYIISKSIAKITLELQDSIFFSYHRACGFEDLKIWMKFCKRFIIVNYLSVFENLLIFMFGFIFFVETPFGIHGIGSMFVYAIQRFDYPLIIGVCIFSIILFSFIGVLVEILITRLDPRTNFN